GAAGGPRPVADASSGRPAPGPEHRLRPDVRAAGRGETRVARGRPQLRALADEPKRPVADGVHRGVAGAARDEDRSSASLRGPPYGTVRVDRVPQRLARAVRPAPG